jgi:selenium metabolism protein YedF
MRKSVDARGLACPQPVIMARKALNDGATSIEILIDNEAARENVGRYLEKNGFSVNFFNESGYIRIEAVAVSSDGIRAAVINEGVSGNDGFNSDDYQCSPSAKVILITSDSLGRGSEELGQKLMQAFIFTVREMPVKPHTIIFMNSGVKLAVRDSASLDNLAALQESGVEILACGTCLDYFGIKESLSVGRISNMYSIAEELMSGNVLRI